jgi:ERCC4-related helicase
LTEACDYIKKGKVDVIPSTSSGYRALDLPKLQNILLVEGLKAGVVLQSIGRIARSDTMNIITLCSMSDKKIPVYSKADQARKEMYQTYYKNCKITEQIIYEYQL